MNILGHGIYRTVMLKKRNVPFYPGISLFTHPQRHTRADNVNYRFDQK